jgi:hypothetical protein
MAYWLSGKPGYGKTHLCASLIERLKYRIEVDKAMPSGTGDDSRLAFYFFDKRQPQTHNSISSIRSILAQLLQANKEDRHLLDLACFAMGESVHPEAVAELGATKGEVLSLITIILQRLNRVTLVFDGVDECSDTQDFFDCLVEVTSSNSCPRKGRPERSRLQVASGIWQDHGSTKSKVVLFCRPDLDVPRELFDKAPRIQLSSQHNLADITAFMLYNLERLVDDGLLECHIDLPSLATSVSSRADGMFLWIRLLIDYLRDTLEPDDRMDALSNPIHLEGLDQLYHAILQRLQQRLPAKARETVQRAFACVAGALRPLHVDEFGTAITITSNKNASSKSTIPNIEHVLTRMSGALLELASDCTVRFIHPSVRDYLHGRRVGEVSCLGFGLERTQTQLHLANLCVIYILERIAAGPLSGSAKVTADRTMTHACYPLLQYSLAFWAEHCTIAFDSLAVKIEGPETSTLLPLIQQIGEFICSKDRVTTWLEASWLFGLPPELSTLTSSLGQLLLSPLKPLELKRVEKITATLWLLSIDVDQLKKDWDSVLRDNPNEIWNPSISNFTPSDFWVRIPGATWKNLKGAVQEQDKAILVESRTLEGSMELGLIKILVPR